MFETMATLTSMIFALNSSKSLDLIGRSKHSKDSDSYRDQLNQTNSFSELSLISNYWNDSIPPTLHTWNIPISTSKVQS